MESKKSKDAFSYSLLPPSLEVSCNGQGITGPCYNVHVNHNPGVLRIISSTANSTDGSVQEKPPLMDVPLNSEQLARLYNKEVPPPYEADSSQQAVWSTEASKVHPGSPRIVGRGNGRVNALCRRLIILLSVIVGLYLCFKGLWNIAENHDNLRMIDSISREVAEAIHEVDDLDNIPAEYEGKLIHVTGRISVSKPLEYEECGIFVPSVKLRRTVDKSNVYKKWPGDLYFSSKEWPDTRLGQDHICTNWVFHGDEFGLDNDEQIANEVKVGPLTLGFRLKQKFSEYYVISEKLVEVNDLEATRVMYSDAGRDGAVFSFLGKLADGHIEPYEGLDYYTIILVMESEESANTMITERVLYRIRKIEAENFWSYITIGMGLTIPLIVILYYMAVMRAMRKTGRNQLMLSMPVQ